MEAIEFNGVNVRIAEDQAEYNTIPAQVGNIPLDYCPDCENGENLKDCKTCRGDGYITHATGMTCCFKLTENQIKQIVQTGIIWQTVITFGQPLQPFNLSTEKPAWVPEQ